MNKISAYLKLIRANNALLAFISTYIAGVIGGTLIFDQKLLFISFSAALIGSAGNVINDLIDYKIDQINRPDRPLPSGAIKKKEAISLYFSLNVLGILLSLTGGIETFLIATFSMGIIFLYSYKLKGIAIAGNFTVAFMTGLTFIYGALPTNNLNNVFFPAFFAFYVNFIREIIKDIEDFRGDLSQGLKTLPIKYGIKRSVLLCKILIVGLLILDLIPFFCKKYNYIYLSIIIFGVNTLLIYSLKLLNQFEDKSSISRASLFLKIVMPIGLIAIWAGI